MKSNYKNEADRNTKIVQFTLFRLNDPSIENFIAEREGALQGKPCIYSISSSRYLSQALEAQENAKRQKTSSPAPKA